MADAVANFIKEGNEEYMAFEQACFTYQLASSLTLHELCLHAYDCSLSSSLASNTMH